jgi:hypothetical protein
MADIDLTGAIYNAVYLENPIKAGGMDQGDVARALYNLYLAVLAICNNLDTDNGTLGTDYLAKIGTPLANAAGTQPQPPGKTTAA